MVSISLVKRRYKLADGTKAETEHLYAQIRFTNPNAFYLRSTGTADKRKAAGIARKLAQEIEDKELPERGKPRHTLEGMFARWIEEYGQHLRSKKDIKWQVELILKVMDGAMPIKEITNSTIHEFVQGAKEDGKSDTVINRCLTRLRATMTYAAEKWEQPLSGKIKWGSHFAKEPEEKVMYISPPEARRFVEVLPPHIGLAFAFSYYTGCRKKELETLTWPRIDFEERVALVETKGKGNAPVYRQLRLSEKALKVLHVVRSRPHPPLKARKRGKEPDPQAVFFLENRRKHWEKARKIVGRGDIDWHGIRHSFGTETTRRAKAGDKLVGKMLGHAPGTNATARYIHVMADDVYEALEHLPDIGLPSL